VIDKLIRLAGAREMPSAEATQRARAAAEQAWRRGLQQRAEPKWSRARRFGWSLALAASCALVVLFVRKPEPAVSPVVASVVAVDARPMQLGAKRQWQTLNAGISLRAAAKISTGDGRAAFLLGESLSLRADRNTVLEFVALDRVRLLQGRVYVDSGGLNVASRLRIDTPAGEVSHLGTQFLVAVQGTATHIRVREGRVALARGGSDIHEVAAGDALEVDGANIRLLQGLSSYGEDWEWTTVAAPSFDIENRPLQEFLEWVAREHGWELAYHDEATRLLAREVRLHGSVSKLEVSAMLQRIALITGVPLQVRGGTLEVGGGAET